MVLIDNQGRLLGLVNVIDALVILLVIAIVVAGVAFVNPFAPSKQEVETATRYATVNLGEQPGYVASQISVGDTIPATNGPGNLTITDVYVAPVSTGTATVVIRAEIRGQLVGTETPDQTAFRFNGTRLRPGRQLGVTTPDYTAGGTITTIDREGAELRTDEIQVLLEVTLPVNVVENINEGDTFRVGQTTGATIDSVYVFPGNDTTTRRVFLGVTFDTITRSNTTFFGNRRITIGTELPFLTDTYGITGRVTELGTNQVEIGETTVLLETTIPTPTADAISVGDEYQVNGEPVATVESITIYPTGNPNTKHTIVGLTLRTVQSNSTPRFADTPIKLGTTIPFSADSYELSGNVTRLGRQSLPGEPTEITATVKLANIAPEIADGIRTGMTETRDGTTYARIEDRRTEPAVVVLTSDSGEIFQREHPVNKDIYLTVTLRTRRTDNGLTFHARSLQEGNEIVLDLEQITIRGTVTDLG